MQSSIVFALFCFYFFTLTMAAEEMTVKLENRKENETVLERWQNIEKGFKNIANSLVKMVLPRLMESSGNMNLSTECIKNTMLLISGIKNIKPWAFRFLDSSAKMIDGVLESSLAGLGSYDECVDTMVRSTKIRDKGKLLFRGQYCMIDIKPPLPPMQNNYKLDAVLPELKNFSQRDTVIAELSKYAQFLYFLSLRVGICTPSGCSREDVDKMAKQLGNVLSLNATASRCEVKEENQFPPLVIAVITAFSFASTLMIIGSLIDIYAYYKKIIYKSTFIKVLLAFSLFTNFQKLSNTETASDMLSCLNGVRFLSMSWIILGHTYFLLNLEIFVPATNLREFAKDFEFQAIINGSVAVDTFFFVGGLLVCYGTISLVRLQGHKLNVGLYIFHRLWRIIPVYACVIMFMFIMNLLGSGPIWHDTTHKYIQTCYDNWWTNLIFINNFYDAEHMCIAHSWYIASDFQLYIGALIILIPMIRWPRVGILFSIIGILASIVYSGLGTYINNHPPTFLIADPNQTMEFGARFYFRPFIHAGPYCVGLIAGYILATKPNLKFSPLVQVVGWSLAFIFNFSVLYGVVEWNRGVEPTLLETILYASFNRVAWSLGVAWMIVCCATGQGGVINYILSWKAFVPLGRLTYVAYLVHPIVQLLFMGNARTQMQLHHFFVVWIFFGHLCISYGIAFAGSMLIESPFMSLEKIILPRGEKTTESSSLVKQNNFLKGSLKIEKNGDIGDIAMVSKTDEESGGMDNKCIRL